MIRTNTWIWLLLLAALILFTILFNRHKAVQVAEATPSAAPVYVFGTDEGLPDDIRITAASGEAVQVERDSSGQWVITAPIEGLASQALAQAAADQIGAMQQLGQVELSPAILGLDKPAFVITIGFSSGSHHTLAIGSKTVTESGYYVSLDGEKEARIIETSGIEALLNLFSAPPYAQTPTPSPAPTSETSETPLPLTETATPGP